jgi:hypothetical protein
MGEVDMIIESIKSPFGLQITMRAKRDGPYSYHYLQRIIDYNTLFPLDPTTRSFLVIFVMDMMLEELKGAINE